MTLTQAIKSSPYHFFFLVVENFLDISLPEIPNFTSVSKKKLTYKNSGKLLADKNIQKNIKSFANPVIVPFKPSAKIEKICQKNHWLLAAPSAKNNRLLEDKIKFYQQCQKAKLPLIDSLILPFNQKNFSKAQQAYGSNLVIQSHFGWAGNSTYNFDNYTSAKKHIPKNMLVKFSPYIQGFSVLNNCCQTKKGLLQSPPALQFTGIPTLTSNPFATVGRQWPSLLHKSQLRQIKKITQNFSKKILQPLNYLGFFGLDFLVTPQKVYLLECNPRLTASFAFYTYMEQKAGLTPLFYHHLAQFIPLDYEFNLKKEQSRFDNPNLIGSQITKRNPSGTISQKIEDFKIITNKVQTINEEHLKKFK